jgi:hypothetical protein
MKLMIAKCCGEIVVPSPQAFHPTFCLCGNSAVWWRNPQRGIISFANVPLFPGPEGLGLHNEFLTIPLVRPQGYIHRDQIEGILLRTPESYIFKRANSVVVRFLPGATSDSKLESWSEALKLRDDDTWRDVCLQEQRKRDLVPVE